MKTYSQLLNEEKSDELQIKTFQAKIDELSKKTYSSVYTDEQKTRFKEQIASLKTRIDAIGNKQEKEKLEQD